MQQPARAIRLRLGPSTRLGLIFVCFGLFTLWAVLTLPEDRRLVLPLLLVAGWGWLHGWRSQVDRSAAGAIRVIERTTRGEWRLGSHAGWIEGVRPIAPLIVTPALVWVRFRTARRRIRRMLILPDAADPVGLRHLRQLLRDAARFESGPGNRSSAPSGE